MLKAEKLDTITLLKKEKEGRRIATR